MLAPQDGIPNYFGLCPAPRRSQASFPPGPPCSCFPISGEASLWRSSVHDQLIVDTEFFGGIISNLASEHLGIPLGGAGNCCGGERGTEIPCLACCHRDLSPEGNGWMDSQILQLFRRNFYNFLICCLRQINYSRKCSKYFFLCIRHTCLFAYRNSTGVVMQVVNWHN